MIYITSDHGGFELKNKLIQHLEQRGVQIANEGPYEFIGEDDYPDYIIPVIEKVRNNPEDKAIIICKNGVGVSMLANKFKGIRAALSWNQDHARSSRTDDDTNVLALPASYISEIEAREITDAWLDTPFSNQERHIRRLNKVANFEGTGPEEGQQ